MLVKDGVDQTLLAWPLMQAFHTELLANPAGNTNHGVKAALDHFMLEANELYKIQCRVCSGYGHTSEYCTTLPRLQAALGLNPTVNSWLSRATKRTYTNVRPGVEKANCMLHLHYKVPKGFKDKFGKIKPKTMD